MSSFFTSKVLPLLEGIGNLVLFGLGLFGTFVIWSFTTGWRVLRFLVGTVIIGGFVMLITGAARIVGYIVRNILIIVPYSVGIWLVNLALFLVVSGLGMMDVVPVTSAQSASWIVVLLTGIATFGFMTKSPNKAVGMFIGFLLAAYFTISPLAGIETSIIKP